MGSISLKNQAKRLNERRLKMAEKKTLMELRKIIKARKPVFSRKDSHKKASLGTKWRKPRGLHNKMRKHLKGHRRRVSSGYSSPAEVRGLHVSGLAVVRVASPKLDSVNPKTQCIEIISQTGNRKRMEIIKEAQKRGILIANIKDPAAFIRQVEEENRKKREEKKGKEEKKSKTKEELKKKAAEKEKEEKKEKEAPLTEEDKAEREKERKEEEKREAERIITQGE